MKNQRLITQILTSIFFKRANVGAARYARNSRSMFELVREALVKSGSLSGASFSTFREQVAVIARLLRAYASGEYRQLPWKTLMRIVAVMVYFVSPIDFLPDFLPIIGLTDDIALMLWLFSGIKDDIEKFKIWESSASNTHGAASRQNGPLKTIKIG